MMTRNTTDSAVVNLRLATAQLRGTRIPPRVRAIPSLRRRVPITVVTGAPEVVNVRHAVQNMDTPVNKTLPLSNQRA